MIDQFKDDYAFLSNFYVRPFQHQGFVVPSGEHAFQMAKTASMEEKLWVLAAETPGIAKRRGRKVTLRADWEQVKISEMLAVSRSKYADMRLQIMLLSTGNEHLVEGNYWHDQFWGNCVCDQHPEAGRNYLGKILMYVRKELRG